MENAFYSIASIQYLGDNERQEDAIGCVLDDMGAVLVLCDGMGGLYRGDLAAQKAVNSVKELMEQYDWKSNQKQFIKEAIIKADADVYELTDEHRERVEGGCTMLIALLLGRELYYANVGDSRIYYFSGQEI